MPKIEVNEDHFFKLLGTRYAAPELEQLLQVAKAELDEWKTDEGHPDSRVIKIELNDTNRPDLWSTAGITRCLRNYTKDTATSYHFLSSGDKTHASTKKIIVDENLASVRPYIAGCIVRGAPISAAFLDDIIQSQEKLCWNFGHKRKTVSMGIYRADKIAWPISYTAVDPKTTRFVPLDTSEEMNLLEILKEHPKGKEYASILEGFAYHPLLRDNKNEVLSYPPIINSNGIGAVKPGDSALFIELTGTDLDSVLLSLNIMACDFADMGYTVESVTTTYTKATKYGKTITCPYYFQKAMAVELGKVQKYLGKSISLKDGITAAQRMGSYVDSHGQHIHILPAPYRNDFLHAVDIIEDIMIGIGLQNFAPTKPQDFTVGRLSPVENFSRRLKDILVGLQYQEMIYGYLGSKKEFIEKMCLPPNSCVQIKNPMSENFEFVRNSALSSLLNSESVSSKASYPHYLCEVGKVALFDKGDNYGVVTHQVATLLCAHASADFNEIKSHVATILFYLGREFTVLEPAKDDPRFIPGRQAQIKWGKKIVGIYGEVHPQVLENFGITVPCAACELDIDLLI